MKKKNIQDDVWYEILLRLPLNSIFRFRCVSKVLFSLLSNPNFINHWYELNKLSLPWALLVHYTNSSQHQLKTMFTYLESHSQFVSHHQNDLSFRFLKSNFPNPRGTEFNLLGSSNGLFLSGTNIFHQNHQITYHVCNPLTQKWVLLPPPPPPPPPPGGFGMTAVTGFICDDKCFLPSLVSASYNVIQIPKFGVAARDFEVEFFSSDLGEWYIVDVSCPHCVTWDYNICDNLVICNGFLYWFQKRTSKIVVVSGTGGNECRLIDMPDQSMDGCHKFGGLCIAESEGSICYASLKETKMSLSVWVLEGDGDWYILHKDVTLHDMLADLELPVIGKAGPVALTAKIRVLGFNPFDKNVVILGYKEYNWAFNSKTRRRERLCCPSWLDDIRACGPHVSVSAFSVKPRLTAISP